MQNLKRAFNPSETHGHRKCPDRILELQLRLSNPLVLDDYMIGVADDYYTRIVTNNWKQELEWRTGNSDTN